METCRQSTPRVVDEEVDEARLEQGLHVIDGRTQHIDALHEGHGAGCGGGGAKSNDQTDTQHLQ